MERSIVRWRASTVRRPPPSAPIASVSAARSCAVLSNRLRAAASSIASGMPSSRSQIADHVSDVLGGEHEVVARRRPVDEEAHRVRLDPPASSGPAHSAAGSPSCGTRQVSSPATLERHSAGRQHRTLGGSEQDRVGRVGARVGDVLAVVEDQEGALVGHAARQATRGSSGARRAVRPGRSPTRAASGRCTPTRSIYHTPSGNVSTSSARPAGRGGPPLRRPDEGDQPVVEHQADDGVDLVEATDERGQGARGGCWAGCRATRAEGTPPRARDGASCHTCSGRARSFSRWVPRSKSSTAAASCQPRGRASPTTPAPAHHGRCPQPRCPHDRAAHVVALVPEPGSPVWIAIRTLSGDSVAMPRTARRRWASSAAATASDAR